MLTEPAPVPEGEEFPVPAIEDPEAKPDVDEPAGVEPDEPEGSKPRSRMTKARRDALKKANAARKEKAAERRAAKQTGSPTRAAVEAEARKSLKRWRAEIGAGALTIVPVPATYIARTDDEVIEAMVRLAGRNARFLDALAKGGDLLAAVVVLRWAAGVVVAGGVQVGSVAPDSMLAASFGLDEIVVDLAREGVIAVESSAAVPVEVQSSDAGVAVFGPPDSAVAVV